VSNAGPERLVAERLAQAVQDVRAFLIARATAS
jgi:hypothetical protein